MRRPYQHMQNALMKMNLQLHHVVADIAGARGMKIIRAIIAGERRPEVLAAYREVRCHASIETIQAALTREAYLRPPPISGDLRNLSNEDRRMRRALGDVNGGYCWRGEGSCKTTRKSPRADEEVNTPAFDVRAALYGMLGVDLPKSMGWALRLR
jgi:transposase